MQLYVCCCEGLCEFVAPGLSKRPFSAEQPTVRPRQHLQMRLVSVHDCTCFDVLFAYDVNCAHTGNVTTWFPRCAGLASLIGVKLFYHAINRVFQRAWGDAVPG